LTLFFIDDNLLIFILKIFIFNIFCNNIIDRMGIGDWGLGIGDWGLGICPIPNPHS
jgi:hypothetical protein